MCGRYGITQGPKVIETTFQANFTFSFEPVYNAAPSMRLPVITSDERQKIQAYQWGLVPFWAKDEKIGYKMINARAEGIGEKPAFRQPVREKRCLVPANCYYEWQKQPDSKTKQPYLLHPTDQETFSFAGIWDEWANKDTGEVLHTFSIITTAPPFSIKHIHDRMPVILPKNLHEVWLDKSMPLKDLTDLLQSYKGNKMDAYRIGTRVNSPRNQGEDIILPVKEEDQGGQLGMF